MKDPAILPQGEFERELPAIPNCQLLKAIGKGGMGEVWLAEELTNHKLQAVKFVFQRTIDDVSKFAREIEGVRLFAPLSRQYDGFVQILDVGLLPNGKGFWYVMELADNAEGAQVHRPGNEAAASEPSLARTAAGRNDNEVAVYRPRTLLGEIECRGRLPATEVLEIGIRLANALAILHEAKPRPLIHRDVKPANILFVQSQPKFGDPGLVVLEKDAPSSLGTPGFSPPEGPAKPESDIYGLGMTLYCALTGFTPERFPELPLDPVPAPQRVVWRRLNAIICRVCDVDSRKRYRNGREMLADLLRVKAGRKPELSPRAKQSIRNCLAVAALIVSTVVLTTLFDARRDAARAEKPEYRVIRTLFEDDFEAAEINRTIWKWGATSRCADGEPAKGSPQPFMASGSLMLEAVAESSGGKECWQCICLDSLVDLKASPHAIVEIDFGVVATNSSAIISVGSADAPVEKSHLAGEGLWTAAGTVNQPLYLPRNTVRIEFSTNSGLAAVWSGATDESGSGKLDLRLFDVSRLEEWKLRFTAHAVSAAEMVPDTTRFWLYRVQAKEVEHAPRIAGWVTNLEARLPGGGVKLRNQSTGTETVANEDGMFMLGAKPGLNRVNVIGPGFRALSNLVVTVPHSGLVRLDVPVEKTLREPGDVIETRWTLPVPSERIAIGDKHVFYYGSNCTIWRMPFGMSEAEPLTKLPNVGTAWANGSLYAVETHLASFLYRVDEDGAVTAGPPLLTQWPSGLAFDGSNFWYLEFTSVHGSRCGLYAMSPSGEPRAHFVSGISDLRSVAAGKGRLWVMAPGRRIYEVVIPPGVDGGQLDDYVVRDFPTKGVCLVYAMDELWVLGMDRRSVQRLWLGQRMDHL